jgi:toxin HigB-1
MAIKSFGDQATADLFNGENTRHSRSIAQKVQKAALAKLSALNAATSLADLNAPGLNLENLKHTMPGYYSIRINDQFRILFCIQDGEFHDVEIADYHGK